jgi:NAD(P)-dependent dehydrogenase (short-subunit alcohol dehydrogenase family)
MSSPKTVYLISGSNRGIGQSISSFVTGCSDWLTCTIGLAISKLALSKPNSIVFAGARNPESAKELIQLAQQNPDRFFPVKLISADKESNEQAVSLIKEKAGQLDVVIANAGNSVSDHISTCIEGSDTLWLERYFFAYYIRWSKVSGGFRRDD